MRFLRCSSTVPVCSHCHRADSVGHASATPSTVVWGYYSAKAKPVLTVHSGNTVHIQTLSTCGPTDRLIRKVLPPRTFLLTTPTSIAK